MTDATDTDLDAIRTHPLGDRIYARLTIPGARAEAAAAARRAREGTRLSLLDGVPISWKDLFDTAGTATEAGSALLKGRVPDRDAAVVRNARAMGLVSLGKTHMSELAFSGLGLSGKHRLFTVSGYSVYRAVDRNLFSERIAQIFIACSGIREDILVAVRRHAEETPVGYVRPVYLDIVEIRPDVIYRPDAGISVKHPGVRRIVIAYREHFRSLDIGLKLITGYSERNIEPVVLGNVDGTVFRGAQVA